MQATARELARNSLARLHFLTIRSNAIECETRRKQETPARVGGTGARASIRGGTASLRSRTQSLPSFMHVCRQPSFDIGDHVNVRAHGKGLTGSLSPTSF